MKTIAVTNQKGGVGKTTTTQHVAAALGERGYRVLAIDLDPQSNLTMAAGVSIDELDHSMYQVLVTRKIELREAIIPTSQGYDLAPADPNLGVADTEMVVGKMNWHLVLKRALAPLRATYDWCLLDCPPSLSALTVNALQAADRVLIPVSPEMWPVKGMQRLFLSIDEARQEGNSRPGRRRDRPDDGATGQGAHRDARADDAALRARHGHRPDSGERAVRARRASGDDRPPTRAA